MLSQIIDKARRWLAYRWPKKFLPRDTREVYKSIDKSGLFDQAFYVTSFGERDRLIRVNALTHYVLEGSASGLDPNPWFNGSHYLATNDDVRATGMNPLHHFAEYGMAEGRVARTSLGLSAVLLRPSFSAVDYYDVADCGVFAPAWYLEQYPDVAKVGIDPLQHYMSSGWREGRDPTPLFGTTFYLNFHRDVLSAGENPLLHYVRYGREEKRPVLPADTALVRCKLFDAKFYLEKNPDVAGVVHDPVWHYLVHGWVEGRSPHPLFDVPFYQDQMPSDLRSLIEPVEYYVRHAGADRLDPNPFFSSDWYRSRFPGGLTTSVNPLVHYLMTPVPDRKDPSALFDPMFYRSRYKDVGLAGIDPLEHFLLSGRDESRVPRPADELVAVCAVLDIPFEVMKEPGGLAGRDVCFYVSFSENGEVGEHVLRCLKALRGAGLAVVFIVATNGLSQPLPAEVDLCEGVIVRRNHGWDFAAWAAAFAICPDAWSASMLVLMNDSVYGPTDDARLDAVLERCRRSSCAIVALTDSHQVRHHLMSYFTVLTPFGLGAAAVHAFWAEVKSRRDKQQVISQYELIGIDHWHDADVSVEVLFPTPLGPGLAINPTLHAWRELIEQGFPFVKVQALRDRLDNVNVAGWRSLIEGNPGLLDAIDTHLGQLDRRAPESDRLMPVLGAPRPTPHRRFLRDYTLVNEHGATPAIRPHPLTDIAMRVPFDDVSDQDDAHVAVVLHVFYVDLLPELLAHIEHIPGRADLFVSTDTDEKRAVIIAALDSYQNGNVVVRRCPNKGRDIAPMLIEFGEAIISYSLVLHIHSKQSLHNDVLSGWREHLLSCLLGSREIVSSIIATLRMPTMGLVFADHFPAITSLINWGHNFETCKRLLARMDVQLTKDMVLEFPTSSFFWARGEALRPLIDLELAWDDFPAEDGQIDGTLAHAIERSLLYVVETAGYRWIKVTTNDRADARRLPSSADTDAVAEMIDRVYRPLLGNVLPPPVTQLLIPEYHQIATVPCLAGRPRLNLVLPSIDQKHVFGGTSTAIRVFEAIGDALGDGFDLRILTVSAAVTLDAMRHRGGYRLAPLGIAGDAGARSIVDASDQDLGEVSIRPGDVFIATAWWTALNAVTLIEGQRRCHGNAMPLIYLVQDYEAAFYPASTHQDLARQSYGLTADMIAIVNAEELADFMIRQSAISPKSYVLRYAPNQSVLRALDLTARERIILIYGRPSVVRNCFEALMAGIAAWQQASPTDASRWRIVSAGERYSPAVAAGVANLEIMGKMTLRDYGALLSRASVGIALMASPHPSYPPLEMAEAGLLTITNDFDGKQLARRHANIRPIDRLTPDAVAAMLSSVIAEAEQRVGSVVPASAIASLDCRLPDFEPHDFARNLEDLLISRQIRIPKTVAA